MEKKCVAILLGIFSVGSSCAFTDSVWIVGAEGCPGDLAPVQVWLQYEGKEETDSVCAFDLLLTYDATVCTVEAITIGSDFSQWTDQSRTDNVGTQRPTSISKMSVTAFTFRPPIGPSPVARGSHLAATVEFRILDTANHGDFTYIDTLWQAFTPSIYLGFTDKKGGAGTHAPAYGGGSIVVQKLAGDVEAVSITSPPDTIYVDSTYIPQAIIKNVGKDSVGPIRVSCKTDSWTETVEISALAGLGLTTASFAGWTVRETGVHSVTIFTHCDTNAVNDTIVKNVYVTSPNQ